jgi:hypothetical protein
VHGTITGAIFQGALHFTWSTGSAHGKGVFQLSDDGDSFEGTYARSGSDDQGVWSGSRD